MEKLRLQCQNAETFPLNLNDIPSWAGEAFKSQSLHSKLDEHQSRLFCDDRKALINVLEYGFGRKGSFIVTTLCRQNLNVMRLVA